MVCKVAENGPLSAMRDDIGAERVCHSFRAGCIHRLRQADARHALGAPGAAIGYCQALFNRAGSHDENTQRIVKLLDEIGAPWHRSHELFWGNRGESAVQEYVLEASASLAGNGRVPILITGLDPRIDKTTIAEILQSGSHVVPGETILLRIVLGSMESAEIAIQIMRDISSEAMRSQTMPRWWPLLQGSFTAAQWNEIIREAGDVWKYANVAMNPWMTESAFRSVQAQITVAQVPVGLAEGIKPDGQIQMASGMVRLTDAPEKDAKYNIYDYFSRALQLESAPILLVLGPSLTEWTDRVNQDRLEALLPLLTTGSRDLWHGLSDDAFSMIWNFAA